MARALWSGALNFGLVTVPVQLYGAIRDRTVRFRQIQRGTTDRIRYRRVNERTGEEVPYDEVVKGYELNGEYVIIEPDELDDIAPARSRSIDIETFVDLEEIDPVYFRKTYWLVPAREEFGRAYSLLFDALTRTNRAGIARFVLRGQEHIAAIRADTDVLVLNTLLFPEDIREPRTEIGTLPELGQAQAREIAMAVSLIETMADRWRPEDYHDTYTAHVLQLIEDKHAGRTVLPEEQPPEATQAGDLLAVLSRSVEDRRPRQESQAADPEAPPERPPRDDPDLQDLSKTTLQATARDLQIEGRSKMNRSQLEQAISHRRRKAERPRIS